VKLLGVGQNDLIRYRVGLGSGRITKNATGCDSDGVFIFFPDASFAAAALIAVFASFGLKVWPPWFTVYPCVGAATDGTAVTDNPNVNPGIKCD
jgi:hypothetical protein